MRVIIPHNKGLDEARRAADETVERLLTLSNPVRVSRVEKRWEGSILRFSLAAGVGPIDVPVHGTVEVTECEIRIHCVLPRLLARLVPERVIQSAVESRVRGLLA